MPHTIHTIGIISDTHGMLRPKAITALQDVEQIIHAGDVDTPEVLAQLESIAPVTAVRGNMDRGTWGQTLPNTAVVEIGEAAIYVLHDLTALGLNPVGAGFQAVIYGHTHEPAKRVRYGVLFLNPGSAGPRRGIKPVTLTIMRVKAEKLETETIDLLGEPRGHGRIQSD